MTSVTISFEYDQEILKIQCSRDEYMKDIFQRYLIKLNKGIRDPYYLYKGTIINPELKLEQINNKDDELKILVRCSDDEDENNENKYKYSNEIICPDCQEICLLDVNDYKFDLYGCKNNHSQKLLFNEFKETQLIDQSKIICNDCKERNILNTTEHKFYKCCTCQKDICLLCQNKSHKDHICIEYQYKNYFCNKHGEKYFYYCKICNLNLCDICHHDECHKIMKI